LAPLLMRLIEAGFPRPPRFSYPGKGQQIMDKDRIKGTVKQVQGKVMEGAGKATDNLNLQAKGKVKKAEGALQETFGKAKDALRKG